MLDKTDYTEEVNKATYDGLNINFNVKFNQEKDNIRYQITIKNEDNEDYELTNTNDFSASKYIEYKVDYDGGNVVKAKSTKSAIITISYAHEVDSSKFINGRFEEPNEFTISLSNNKRIVNPKTGGIVLVVGVVLGLLILGSVIALKGNTKTKLMSILIGLLVLPITTFALTKITIKVDSKVVVEKDAEFCVMAYNYDSDEYDQENLKFEPGMNWEEYLDSDYNTKFIGLSSQQLNLNGKFAGELATSSINLYNMPYRFASYEYIACIKDKIEKRVQIQAKLDACGMYDNENVDIDSLIHPKSVGCYLTDYYSEGQA